MPPASPDRPSITDARPADFDAPGWLAAIVSSSDDAIISKRLDGTIVSWNEGARRLFGYEASEILGRSIMVLIPADRRAEEEDIIERLVRGERVEHFETIRVRKDGTHVAVSLSVSPVRDATGKIVGAAKIARDVSEQRRLVVAGEAARAAAESAAARIARLQSMTAALAAARTPTDVARVMAAEGQRATGANAGVLAARGDLLDTGGNPDEVFVIEQSGLDPAVAASWRRFPLSADSASSRAIRTGEPVWLETREEILERVPGVREAVVAQHSFAVASVPIQLDGQTVAAMTYSWHEPRRISEEEREFFLSLARQASQALERARLAESERRARSAAERLQSLTAALSAAPSRDAVGEVVMHEGVAALGAYAGVLALYTADGGELELLSSLGYPPEACMSVGRRWPADAKIPMAEAARTGEPVFVPSPEEWGRRYLDGYAPQASRSRAWAALPLLADGNARGALLWSYDVPREFRSDERALMMAIARQCSQALERTRLYESERAAHAEAERAARRVAFLARASAALASSLDVRSTLDTVASLAVPELADWAFVEMLDPDGIPRPAAIRHADEEKARLGWVYLTRWPIRAEYQHGTMQVARTGAPALVPEIPVAVLDHVAQDAEHRRVLGEIGFVSSVQVPLRARGRVVGVLTFATAESGRRYGAEDLSMAEEVAARASSALENAELYEAERAARAAAEVEAARAAEASRAKSDFLATMSHELRTPLNAVAGYVELIELGIAGPVTDQQRDYLTRLRASSTHLLGLINDVLDLSKIDAGQMTVVDEVAEVAAAVRAASTIALPQADARNIRLLDEPATRSAASYLGDPDRVRQILVNLLSNAVKFTEPGGRIVVHAGEAAEAAPAARVIEKGPWTFIAVEDTGIGIAAELQAAVFDPFVQAESGRTRTRGGTGLGLAISRRLARLMGGDVTLESSPGAGSTFTLWLPAPGAAADRSERPAPGVRHPRGLAPLGAVLRASIEPMVEAWDARLRADPALAITRGLAPAQVEDHTLSFLADVVQSLLIVDQTGGLDSELLRDGSEIQRVIAERHGLQRRQLGFSELQVAREYEILADVVSSRLDRITGADPEDRTLAVGVVTRLIMHARAAAVRAFREAAKG